MCCLEAIRWRGARAARPHRAARRGSPEAFRQLRQYALALENPPLLIVSDMQLPITLPKRMKLLVVVSVGWLVDLRVQKLVLYWERDLVLLYHF